MLGHRTLFKLLSRSRLADNSQILTRSLASQYKTSFGGWIMLIIPVSTFGLGTWQVYRRRWKLDLIESLNSKLIIKPIDLPTELDEINKLEYRKVRVRGHFDHSNEMFITPRSLVSSRKEKNDRNSLFTHGKQSTSGAWVVTPFILDSGKRILINRGWISRNRMDPKTRSSGQVEREVELTGVVRLNEKRPIFGVKNKINSRVWHFRDVDGMAEMLNTEPIFLDADYHSTVEGGPVGGQTRIDLRNEHFSYIITWYGLCLVSSLIWYLKFRSRKFSFI